MSHKSSTGSGGPMSGGSTTAPLGQPTIQPMDCVPVPNGGGWSSSVFLPTAPQEVNVTVRVIVEQSPVSAPPITEVQDEESELVLSLEVEAFADELESANTRYISEVPDSTQTNIRAYAIKEYAEKLYKVLDKVEHISPEYIRDLCVEIGVRAMVIAKEKGELLGG